MTSTSENNDFSGVWHCCYWYSNTKHNNREELSEYHVRIEPSEHGGYVLHSLSGRGEAKGSYLQARFTVDGKIATGTWLEDTSPEGDWEGMTYKGAVQLIERDEGKRWEGQWIATSYNNANPMIANGRWELTRSED